MSKIILCAESACDLSEELKSKYQVHLYPYHITLGEEHYQDGVDIDPEKIYEAYRKNKILPKTSAINPQEYVNFFKPWVEQGYHIIHLSLSSGISSSYQNCCLAAQELPNVFPIDSRSLSTGYGLLVLEAAERIAQGMPAAQIQQEITALRDKVEASFILDTLTYMHAGGRCSGVAALGANILGIKPCIEVDSLTGKMGLGKKYRGSMEKVLNKYTTDKLQHRQDLDLKRIFITHTGISDECVQVTVETIKEMADFQDIFVTRAGCTISSHSGPGTLGILFRRK
ncbi:MAG: DegV family protein [Peptococcia bacterium]